jgi:hypothetical protein
MLSNKDFSVFQQVNGPCQLAKTDEDAIVSPLLVIILGLKTLGLVLKKTDELTNMTEKEDCNGKRNSQACRGSKNGLAARRFMKKCKWQVLGLSWITSLLKMKTCQFSQHKTGCYVCSHPH